MTHGGIKLLYGGGIAEHRLKSTEQEKMILQEKTLQCSKVLYVSYRRENFPR